MIAYFIFTSLAVFFFLATLLFFVGMIEQGFFGAIIGAICLGAMGIALYNAGCSTTPWILNSSELVPQKDYAILPVEDGLNILYKNEKVFKIRGYEAVDKIKNGNFSFYHQEFRFSEKMFLTNDQLLHYLKIFDIQGKLLESFNADY